MVVSVCARVPINGAGALPGFVHGWRRKSGALTLMIACFLMVMWIRSRLVIDCVEFSTPHRQHAIASFWGRIALKSADLSGPNRSGWFSIDLRQLPSTLEKLLDLSDLSGRNPIQWVVPYWSVTIPLTTLSAYLLVSAPRKPKSELKHA